MKVLPPTECGINAVIEALRSGDIVAYPTETVYGLGVNPRDERALNLLFRDKGRDSGKAVLLVIDDLGQLDGLVAYVSPRARRFIQQFWPGPLSLLLPAIPELPTHLCGPEGKVCVRQPSCEIARAICRGFGGAITSTSANPAGGRPARCVRDIELSGVSVAIDGGELPESPPSTIFDPETGRILREGAVLQKQIVPFL